MSILSSMRQRKTRFNPMWENCRWTIGKKTSLSLIHIFVRKLRGAGAKVNGSCGIHVHVDASAHTPQTLRNMVNIMAAKEELLYKALQVQVSRENYCQKADLRFLDEVNRKRPKTMAELERLWYNGESNRYIHYDTRCV